MSTVEQYRAKLKCAVGKAVADSGVDLSAISADQQARLVDAVAARRIDLGE